MPKKSREPVTEAEKAIVTKMKIEYVRKFGPLPDFLKEVDSEDKS